MALLDSIFSGERSVTASLANLFAGNALVICPGEQGDYDPLADTYEQAAATDFPVRFIQETMKRNVLTHVGGVQIAEAVDTFMPAENEATVLAVFATWG